MDPRCIMSVILLTVRKWVRDEVIFERRNSTKSICRGYLGQQMFLLERSSITAFYFFLHGKEVQRNCAARVQFFALRRKEVRRVVRTRL